MYVDLSGLRRCEQRWDAMRPVEGGRLCAACDRRIVDFRALSDEQVARAHLDGPGPVCGVYSDAQLARLGLVAAAPARPGRALPVLALGASLLGTAAAAQHPPTSPAEAAARSPAARAAPAPAGPERDAREVARDDTISIAGTVRDGETGEPLAGVRVWVEGTGRRVITDPLGTYRLRAPEVELRGAHPASLAFTRIGYETQRLPLPATGSDVRLDLALRRARVELTAFYVTATRPSLWQRVRGAVGRLF